MDQCILSVVDRFLARTHAAFCIGTVLVSVDLYYLLKVRNVVRRSQRSQRLTPSRRLASPTTPAWPVPQWRRIASDPENRQKQLLSER